MFDAEIEVLLEDAPKNLSNLAEGVYKGHNVDLAVYLIQVGLEQHRSRLRSQTRRVLKATVIKPHIDPPDDPKPATAKPFTYNNKPSVKTQRKAVEKAVQAVKGILQTWMIGGIPLGDFTKDMLITEAKNERARGAGHIVNAIIYERLAEPMNSFETVKDNATWQSDEAVRLIRSEVLNAADVNKLGFVGDQPTAGV